MKRIYNCNQIYSTTISYIFLFILQYYGKKKVFS